MKLVIGGFIPHSIERDNEYQYCLLMNLKNRYIDEVHVLVESNVDEYKKHLHQLIIASDKLRLINLNKRPTFSDLFCYANNFNHGTISIFCNSDIYIDESLGLLNNFNMDDIFICLSRAYDVAHGSITECDNRRWCDSQDTWVAKSPIKMKNFDYYMGTCGCDNRLVYEARISGYRVINPVLSIKTYHVHCSQYRTYDIRFPVPGPYQHCHDYELK